MKKLLTCLSLFIFTGAFAQEIKEDSFYVDMKIKSMLDSLDVHYSITPSGDFKMNFTVDTVTKRSQEVRVISKPINLFGEKVWVVRTFGTTIQPKGKLSEQLCKEILIANSGVDGGAWFLNQDKTENKNEMAAKEWLAFDAYMPTDKKEDYLAKILFKVAVEGDKMDLLINETDDL